MGDSSIITVTAADGGGGKLPNLHLVRSKNPGLSPHLKKPWGARHACTQPSCAVHRRGVAISLVAGTRNL
jgi:hypothetical protein